MNNQNELSLEVKNDMLFMKLIKQAPIYTIMLLHERLKDILSLNERYFIIRDIINKQFSTKFSSSFIQQQIEFFSSSDLFQYYLMFFVDVSKLINDYQKLNNYSIIFTRIEPMTRQCIFCVNNDEMLPVFQLSKSFVFNEHTLEQCLVLYSYCKICKWSYYPNSYMQDATRKQYVEKKAFMNANLFYFGGESVYSHRLLLAFSSALLCMYASFHGFVKNYYSLIKHHLLEKNGRKKLPD